MTAKFISRVYLASAPFACALIVSAGLLVPGEVSAQPAVPKAETSLGKPPVQPEAAAATGVRQANRRPRNLADITDTLYFSGSYTLLPKNGVIFAPKHLRDRIGAFSPGKGKYLGWKAFYAANSSWLLTETITKEQAMGKAPLPEARVKAILAANRVVVAVNGGNLIGYMGGKIEDPKEKQKP